MLCYTFDLIMTMK